MIEELKIKQKRINELLNKKALDGVMLFRSDNFAWITGGASSLVNKFTDEGIAALLITRDRKYLITNKIEEFRMMEEEAAGLGYELVSNEWYESCENIYKELLEGKRIGSEMACKVRLTLGKRLKN